MRRSIRGFWPCLLLACALLAGGSALPVQSAQAQSAEGMQRLARDLWPAAKKRGVSRRTFDRAFAGLTPDMGVLADAANQAEFRQSVSEYLKKRLSEERIANGRAMAAKHASRVAAIEKRYGVDRHVLLAIWGLESNYGDKMGDYDAIRALATLALTRSRARFGRSQLLAALKILERGDVSREQFHASWAGAMGHTQFIPTTYEAYAVDWTGDGKRDIWNSISDALASTGNYLSKSGWRSGLTWGWRVTLPKGFKHTGRRTVAEWEKLGVTAMPGGRAAPRDTSVTLLRPEGRNGPAYLVTRNFRAILAYNNANAYALSVGLLADRIRSGAAESQAQDEADFAILEPAGDPQ
ncbi:MAG: lytic transglycosylase domain-containing protein [Parvibaculaceae bacterium]